MIAKWFVCATGGGLVAPRGKNRVRGLKRALVIVAIAFATFIGAAIIGWAAYALVAWLGYSRIQVDRQPDPLVDRFMPKYEISERHEIRVAAPAHLTYAAACAFDLQQSAIIRGIFRGREILLHPPPERRTLPTQLLAQTLQIGWGVLAEEPGRELVMGAVTQPWEPQVVFRSLPPERFAAFDAPGFAQIVWTLSAQRIDARTSVFRTITRVRTTDENARQEFRRYWSIYSPGILLIRSEALRVVRSEAERRYREGGKDMPPAPCPR
jgi:hypothetical protein